MQAGYFALFDMYLIPRRRKLSMLIDTRGNANHALTRKGTYNAVSHVGDVLEIGK